MRIRRALLITLFVSLVIFAPEASSQESTSASFQLHTPTFNSGLFSSSTSFSVSSVLSQMTAGSSTASSYGLFSSFLYFPYVTTPVVGATPGANQVALSWTSASASGGWIVGAYEVGQSTVSNGPYTFSNVGNTLSSTQTSLTAGVPYFFVIRVLDGIGTIIATSTEVSATPTAPVSGGGGGGGGGSGGGGGYIPPSGGSGVNFSGRAYPRSTITVLKDAQIVATTIADTSATFSSSVTGLSAGNYFFSIYSEDNQGRRSSLLTFPVSVTSNVITNITGIFVAPTIAVDKSEVRRGDNIAIFGQTTVSSDVTIQVNSEEPYFAKTKADASGVYLYNFDTAPLEYGDHSTKSKASIGNEISSFSSAVPFVVGTKNVAAIATIKSCTKKGDVNGDCKINLVDFSIVGYWYKRAGVPVNIDVNGDGKVTLTDFSIMAFNWTG